MKIKLDFITNSSSANYIVFDSRDVPDRKVMKTEITIDFMDNVVATFETVDEFMERYVKVDDSDPSWRLYEDKKDAIRDLSEKEYNEIIGALLRGNAVHFYWEDVSEPISQFFTGEDIEYKFYEGP